MCGIAGYISLDQKLEIKREPIESMIASLHHRGPDERGVYLDDHTALGHTRLSIIDLESGTQPISNEDERFWIIYNGEVYNFESLKSDLIRKGHVFKTHTDTEVILHLFEEEGPECLNKLNGQFAFAIWDNQKQELFLARDRIGIRPLYYCISNGMLIFASEMKAILQYPGVSAEISSDSLDQIFTFWTTLPGMTPFQNIRMLKPGHFMKVSGNKTDIQSWWELPFQSPEQQDIKSFDTLKEEFDALLTDAVKIRLRSDVPVGAYLSGGLDSSTIVSKIVGTNHPDLNTFGIRFQTGEYDEGIYQKEMVEYLLTRHHDIKISSKDITNSLFDTVMHCETPLLRTSPVPLYLLSDLVNRNQMKVVLTGEGADEMLGGYNIFREAKARRFWGRHPESAWRNLLIQKLYPYIFRGNDSALMNTFFSKGIDQIEDPFYSHRIRWENTSKIKKFLSKDFSADKGTELHLDQLWNQLPKSFYRWDSLSKAQYLETQLFMSNYLLASQGDRVAMAHSVEVRLPFLDYRIMEFAGKLKSHWKIRGMEEKYILKKCMEGKLPEKITKRPKQPYRAPIEKDLLMQKENRELVSSDAIQKAGIFDSKKTELFIRKVNKRDQLSEIDAMTLTGILTTQMLYHGFVSSKPQPMYQNESLNVMIDNRTKAKAA